MWLSGIVYQGLCLSSEARKRHTSGEIINYMAVDVARIADFSFWVNDIWVLPLQVGLALGILYKVVGIFASVAALVTTIVTILLNVPLVRLQKRFQEKIMAAKDLRMKTTSEALRSMRILKLQVEIYTTVVASGSIHLNNLIFSILLLSSEQCVCVCVCQISEKCMELTKVSGPHAMSLLWKSSNLFSNGCLLLKALGY
jgi:hypothetical protein